MLIAVSMQRGPSPVYIEVQGTEDEQLARRTAFVAAYEGHSDPNNAENELDKATISQYTEIITPASVVVVGGTV